MPDDFETQRKHLLAQWRSSYSALKNPHHPKLRDSTHNRSRHLPSPCLESKRLKVSISIKLQCCVHYLFPKQDANCIAAHGKLLPIMLWSSAINNVMQELCLSVLFGSHEVRNSESLHLDTRRLAALHGSKVWVPCNTYKHVIYATSIHLQRVTSGGAQLPLSFNDRSSRSYTTLHLASCFQGQLIWGATICRSITYSKMKPESNACLAAPKDVIIWACVLNSTSANTKSELKESTQAVPSIEF